MSTKEYNRQVAGAKLRAGLALTISDWALVLRRSSGTVRKWVCDPLGVPVVMADGVRPLRFCADTVRLALADRELLAPWFDSRIIALTEVGE